MQPVYIFRHVANEGPGYFAEYLTLHGIPHELICIDQGQRVPPDHRDAAGLVFMGGHMSVNDPFDWVRDEIALIQSAHGQNKPVLGFCLGAQLISKALGGTVTPGGKGMEIGWHPVTVVERTSQWVRDLPERFTPFHWHGETFTLPDGAEHLFANACFANQAFASGNTLALQFHPELTAEMICDWLQTYSANIDENAPCTQPPAAILADIEHRVMQARQVAQVLFDNWCSRLG